MKLKDPLFSKEAHGSINKVLTFSRRGNINVLRNYTAPTGTASALQETQRTAFGLMIAAWNTLTGNEKAAWNALAYLLPPLSGYNIFLGRTEEKRAVRMFGNALFSQAVFGNPGL